jgi:geranylgeranyl transferase type-2 subunit beta
MASLTTATGREDEGLTKAIPFYKDLHTKYVVQLGENTETYEYQASEHLRMSGVYWSLMAMELMNAGDLMKKEELAAWVVSTQQVDGGWGANRGHDTHLLYTTSAVQILAICGQLDKIDADKVASYVRSLQLEDGSFVGDKWMEVDTRFSYCALLTLAILKRLDRIDVKKATDFVSQCKNFDGGFGCVPGAESHAAQCFCCIAALSIGNALHHVDQDQLGWWLAERQCDSGGLNGRPEKQADVCYSWWVLSILEILGRSDWIDKEALKSFILRCQDEEGGGIGDHPGNMSDVFHTYFGIAGLCMLDFFDGKEHEFNQIHPTFALPEYVCKDLGLKAQFFQSVRYP